MAPPDAAGGASRLARTPARTPLGAENGVHALGRAVEHRRREVRVHVRCGGEVGVPEDARYGPEVLARFDHQRREGMAQVMEALVRELEGKVDSVTLLPEWEGTTVTIDSAPDYAAAERAATANAAQTLAAAGYRPSGHGGIAKTGGSGPAPAPTGGADAMSNAVSIAETAAAVE